MTDYYVGIDPGFTGALAGMDAHGRKLWVNDLPVIKGKRRQFDLVALNSIIYHMVACHKDSCIVGLEDPTTRPREGAERCKRFGEGIGLLKGMMTAHCIPFKCVPPNLWKGRLGLPGKDKPGANQAGAQLLVTHYPSTEKVVYGPRGGIKDGRLDALLIAHWVRMDHDVK